MPRVNYFKDPEAFRSAVPERGRKHLVVSLDLGTNCGYTIVLYTPDDPVTDKLIDPMYMGQLDLSAGPYDSGALRFLKLRQFLAVASPDLVVHEDVKYVPAKMPGMSLNAVVARVATSSEFLGALKATAATWCEENGIPCTGFSVTEIKKRATGKGNANKKDIIEACNASFGTSYDSEGYETSGVDNIADSAFCAILGLERYGKGIVRGEMI